MALNQISAGPAAQPRRLVWRPLPSLAGYKLGFLWSDLAAGLTLLAIAVPEQMATAQLGGFAPQIGFLAFIAGSLAFAVFGGSRVLSAGADSTITPIFAGGLAALALAGPAPHAALAALLALMVGVLLVAAGTFRLGWIADLLSIPVTVGFLAGIAGHIAVGQIPGALGLSEPGGDLLQQMAGLAREAGGFNPYCAAIAAGMLVLVIGCERLGGRIPGALVGLAGATIAVLAFGLERHGVAVLGAAPATLPGFAAPAASFDDVVHLVPLSLIVAAVVMVQTAATARAFVPNGEDAPIDRDFAGMGAGCLLSGLMGAFPVNASPPRTAIVRETGGRSQIAGLVGAAAILALLVFGGGLLAHTPKAALSGILLFVALRIVRVKDMRDIARRAPLELLLVAATAAAVVLLPIETGIGIGIALSLLHGLWAASRAKVIELQRIPGTTVWWPNSEGRKGETLSGVAVVALQAALSFLNGDALKAGVLAILERKPAPRVLILEATSVADIDYTAAQALAEICRRAKAQNVGFAVARLESTRARAAFERLGLLDLIGRDRLFASVDEATKALSR